MKKNGFFSMSLVYSFFIVFAMISAVLLANYAHNRLLLRNFNADIKDSLDARGNTKLANLKNLFQNSNFELDNSPSQTYWVFNGVSIANNQRFSGNRGVMFPVSSSTNTLVQELKDVKILKGHTYYFQRKMFTSGQPVEFTNTKVTLENPSKGYTFYFVNDSAANGVISYKNNNWQTYGSFLTIDNTIEETTGWSFVFSQTNSSRVKMYLDCFVLVDVTKSYVPGLIPPVEWLNDNIPYFENKYIHNKSDYDPLAI